LTTKHQNLLLILHQFHKSCFCRSVSSLFHVFTLRHLRASCYRRPN